MNRKMTLIAVIALAAQAGLAVAQEGDGTRVDDRVERRGDRRQAVADNHEGEGDGTRVDDRVERRGDRREAVADNHEGEGDGTRVDDRVERRDTRRDTRQDLQND